MKNRTSPVQPFLLTAREAARVLAVSPRTVWGLTAAGELPCVRIRRAVRYDVNDLRAFIDQRKANVDPEKG